MEVRPETHLTMLAKSLTSPAHVLQVVDTTRPFEGGLLALSSFGFGGANMHMVMEGRGGSRINLVQTDSSSSSSDSASEDGAVDVVTPLAARTSEGLAYLAKIINEVMPSPLYLQFWINKDEELARAKNQSPSPQSQSCSCYLKGGWHASLSFFFTTMGGCLGVRSSPAAKPGSALLLFCARFQASKPNKPVSLAWKPLREILLSAAIYYVGGQPMSRTSTDSRWPCADGAGRGNKLL